MEAERLRYDRMSFLKNIFVQSIWCDTERYHVEAQESPTYDRIQIMYQTFMRTLVI